VVKTRITRLAPPGFPHKKCESRLNIRISTRGRVGRHFKKISGTRPASQYNPNPKNVIPMITHPASSSLHAISSSSSFFFPLSLSIIFFISCRFSSSFFISFFPLSLPPLCLHLHLPLSLSLSLSLSLAVSSTTLSRF
jgi:hypothetical protein